MNGKTSKFLRKVSLKTQISNNSLKKHWNSLTESQKNQFTTLHKDCLNNKAKERRGLNE